MLAPGTKPTDFLNYVSWERSLDRLRAKRCARLNIRSVTSHASQARTFGIFERAVLKHPGSIELWLAYLEFTAQVKATKRWRRIMTRALRLHPMNASLWTLAGRRAAQNGDMQRARAHFLRGCRFCTREPTLWLEYARCEMDWLVRMEAKKQGQGVRKGVNALEAIKATEGQEEGDIIPIGEDTEDDSGDEDGLILPDPDAEGTDGTKKAAKPVFDAEQTKKLEQSPALSGAIPIAIFDVARKQPFWGPVAAEKFFDVFAKFGHLSCHERIISHVVATMQELFPSHPCTWSVHIRQPLVGVDVLTPAFPKALRESLARLKAALQSTTDRKALATKMVAWVNGILAIEKLDAAIRTVLEHTKRSLEESPS